MVDLPKCAPEIKEGYLNVSFLPLLVLHEVGKKFEVLCDSFDPRPESLLHASVDEVVSGEEAPNLFFDEGVVFPTTGWRAIGLKFYGSEESPFL